MDEESLLCITLFRLAVKNFDEWSIVPLEFDPSQSLVSFECHKVFINRDHIFINIIRRAEFSCEGYETVD